MADSVDTCAGQLPAGGPRKFVPSVSAVARSVVAVSDDLRALMAGSSSRLTTVEAVYRTRRHHERLSAAFAAHTEQLKRSGTAIATVSARRSGPAGPPEAEAIVRVWRNGDLAREEHESMTGQRGLRRPARPPLVVLELPHRELSNQHDHRVGGNAAQELSLMLDPSPSARRGGGHSCRAQHDRPPGDPHRARSAAPVRSERLSLPFALHQIGIGADQYRLDVDQERGVLLEATALRSGQPFHRVTTSAIVFDHPIPDTQFAFKPPPGEDASGPR